MPGLKLLLPAPPPPPATATRAPAKKTVDAPPPLPPPREGAPLPPCPAVTLIGCVSFAQKETEKRAPAPPLASSPPPPPPPLIISVTLQPPWGGHHTPSVRGPFVTEPERSFVSPEAVDNDAVPPEHSLQPAAESAAAAEAAPSVPFGHCTGSLCSTGQNVPLGHGLGTPVSRQIAPGGHASHCARYILLSSVVMKSEPLRRRAIAFGFGTGQCSGFADADLKKRVVDSAEEVLTRRTCVLSYSKTYRRPALSIAVSNR